MDRAATDISEETRFRFIQLSLREKSLLLLLLVFFALDSTGWGGAFVILGYRRRHDDALLLNPNYGECYSILGGRKVWRNGVPVIEEMGLTKLYIFSLRGTAQKMLDRSVVPDDLPEANSSNRTAS